MDFVELQALFHDVFPLRAQAVELVVTETREDPTRSGIDVRGVMRLVVFEPQSDTIVTIKEQELVLVPAAVRQDPRLEAAVRGWAQAFVEAIDMSVDLGQRLEAWVPYDLWFLPQLLTLQRAQTQLQFANACLQSRSRFGWLRDPPR